ncbi:MAG: glycosyltransferase [Candidatus Babeliales bacterium]
MNVLIIINNVPDYKNKFIEKLASHCELTVVAEKNKTYDVVTERNGYSYIELETVSFKFFNIQKGLRKHIGNKKYDVIICSWNIRYIDRVILFLLSSKRRSKWIWWGHIYGKSDNDIIARIRRFMLNKASGILVYSPLIKEQLDNEKIDANIISFNNSEVSVRDFRVAKWNDDKFLKILFVGRYQTRKRLDRLIDLMYQFSHIKVRLIGPGMTMKFGWINHDRLELKDKVNNNKLDKDFSWCDIVVSPGHLGLLVMNSARYGKPILVSSTDLHAPEVSIAYESKQYFLDFDNPEDVKSMFNITLLNRETLREKAKMLQEIAREKYNIEYMVKCHVMMLEIINKQ